MVHPLLQERPAAYNVLVGKHPLILGLHHALFVPQGHTVHRLAQALAAPVQLDRIRALLAQAHAPSVPLDLSQTPLVQAVPLCACFAQLASTQVFLGQVCATSAQLALIPVLPEKAHAFSALLGHLPRILAQAVEICAFIARQASTRVLMAHRCAHSAWRDRTH